MAGDTAPRIVVDSITFDYHAPMTYGAGEPGSTEPVQISAHVRAIAPTVEMRATIALTSDEVRLLQIVVGHIAARAARQRETIFEQR